MPPRSTKNRQPRREMVPRIWACAMRLPSTPTIDGDKSDNREEARSTVTSEESEGAPLLHLRGPGASDPVFPSHFPAGGWNLRRTKRPCERGDNRRRQVRWRLLSCHAGPSPQVATWVPPFGGSKPFEPDRASATVWRGEKEAVASQCAPAGEDADPLRIRWPFRRWM